MHHLVKCLLCVMILNLPVFCWGEADGELYLVERQVDSQSSVERDSVAKDALIGLLTKVTGLRNVPRSLRIKEALNGPAAFYSGFSYKPNNEGDGFLITYDFDKYLIFCKLFDHSQQTK